MEDIENPYWTDLNKVQQNVFWNWKIINTGRKEFVLNEHKNFDLAGKIVKLDTIIDDILNKLKKEKYEYMDELVNKIKENKKLLKELLVKYNEIKEKYLQFDKFYNELFYFHLDSLIAKNIGDEWTRFTAIMNNIQIIMRDKFFDFRQRYFAIRNSFFDINQYIIKIKKMFNF